MIPCPVYKVKPPAHRHANTIAQYARLRTWNVVDAYFVNGHASVYVDDVCVFDSEKFADVVPQLNPYSDLAFQ